MAVEAVGIGQEGHRDPAHIGHIDPAVGVPLLLGAVGAHMGDPGLVQHVQGAVDAVHPLVQGVVVSGTQQVEARILDVIGQLVGGVEAGVSGVVGPSGQGGLQIGHGEVGQLELPGRLLEDVAVVIGIRLGHIAVVGEGHVAHDVPRHHQVGDDGLRSRFGLRLQSGELRLDGGLGDLGGLVRRLSRGAAGQQDQAQYEGKNPFHTRSASILA